MGAQRGYSIERGDTHAEHYRRAGEGDEIPGEAKAPLDVAAKERTHAFASAGGGRHDEGGKRRPGEGSEDGQDETQGG